MSQTADTMCTTRTANDMMRIANDRMPTSNTTWTADMTCKAQTANDNMTPEYDADCISWKRLHQLLRVWPPQSVVKPSQRHLVCRLTYSLQKILYLQHDCRITCRSILTTSSVESLLHWIPFQTTKHCLETWMTMVSSFKLHQHLESNLPFMNAVRSMITHMTTLIWTRSSVQSQKSILLIISSSLAKSLPKTSKARLDPRYD